MLVREEGLPLGRIDRPAGGGAAAIWMPFEWLGPTPLLTELRGLPAMLDATGLGRFRRLWRHPRATWQPITRWSRRHAYLWFLGVTPAAQGHGIGSALLRAANARLDADGLPAFLETAPPATSPSTTPRLQGDLRTQGPPRRPHHVEHVARTGAAVRP